MKSFSLFMMLLPLEYMASETVILKGYEPGGFVWWFDVLAIGVCFSIGANYYGKK